MSSPVLVDGSEQLKINIRPAVSVYATYRRLSYKPWYAIAEFVDNSTQSYYDHRDELRLAYQRETRSRLRIEITYDADNNTLSIIDNANGMDLAELTRAVVLDRPPLNRAGRCEFGMGLKTAACWIGTTWTITTTRLGSNIELSATIHVPDLVQNHIEEVEVEERPAQLNDHFTQITISGLYKPIRGRTPQRIKDQLGSMYRQDLRSKETEIIWNGEPVTFDEPQFLTETIGTMTNTWRKEISFDVSSEMDGTSLPATGWVGLRTPGSQRDAGFALLRRGRVIVGGPGEGYKPVEIFGQGNTFRSQRLVGELHMDEWPVTQAKDAFDWSGGLEDAFIESLKRGCQDYMDKAEGYRERGRPISAVDMELASEGTREVFADTRFSTTVANEIEFPDPPSTIGQESADTAKLRAVSTGPIQYRLDVGTAIWLFRLHWQDQLSDAHWMQVSYPQENEIDIFLNVAHPFFAPYLHKREFLELLQKLVLSLALAERMARQTASNGLIAPGDFRTYMNKVLRRAAEIEVDHGG